MRIFWNKQTGDIIGTVDGFDDAASDGVTIIPGGVDPKDIGVHVIDLGHDQEGLARDLMSPVDTLNIRYLRADENGVYERSSEEITQINAEQAQQLVDLEAARQEAVLQPSLQQQVDELKKQVAAISPPTKSQPNLS